MTRAWYRNSPRRRRRNGTDGAAPRVTAHAAEGTKCPRCWQVKRDGDATGLCARCQGILAAAAAASA